MTAEADKKESFGFTKDTEAIARRASFAESLDRVLQEQVRSGSGYLMKKSSNGLFNKRWVVVHGHYLSYFKSDPAAMPASGRTPQGALDLWHVESVSLDDATITLRLSPHASQARMTEMGGERAKRLVAAAPLAKSLAKRLDMARREVIASPRFVLRAASASEAQKWLFVMRESPLIGSLAAMQQILQEEGALIVKELRVSMPPRREFIFADVSSIFDGATDILLRNVPPSGSTINVLLVGGDNAKQTQVEGQVLFEPSTTETAGVVVASLPADVNVEVKWERKRSSWRTKVYAVVAVFIVMTIISLILIRAVTASVIVGVFCAAGTIYLMIKQEAVLNDVVIRGVTIVKPETVGSPKPIRPAVIGLSNYVPTDPHITAKEAPLVAELRERLRNAWSVRTDADTFIKKHEKFLREWHADLQAVKNPEKIKLTMDKHILEDFRLVRYLRARKNKIDKAEVMARDSLMWRVALGSDMIHNDDELGMPAEWLVEYFGSRNIGRMLRPVEDAEERLEKFYLRDKEGGLGVFLRAGRLNTRKIFKKLSGKPCYMIKLVVWVAELLRNDLEKHREKNPDKPETVLSVIVDLDGFAISEQLPLGDLIPMARRFFPIFATSYPELLHRVLVFNAPWLFGSVWSAVKPFIPEEVQEKIQIHSGSINYDKHIRPYFDDMYVPKYFGGKMVDQDDGSEFCFDRVPPYGPYGLPNEGHNLLEGIEPRAQAW